MAIHRPEFEKAWIKAKALGILRYEDALGEIWLLSTSGWTPLISKYINISTDLDLTYDHITQDIERSLAEWDDPKNETILCLLLLLENRLD